MKKIFFAAIILQSFLSIAQNLVQNPSFENFTSCPNGAAAIANATNWNSFSNSCDYFNSCSSQYNSSLPENTAGYQFPHTGNAYAGIITFDKAGFYREAIGNKLSSSLIIGQKYYISFYTCLTIKAPNNAFASNNLGAKFTNIAYSTNPPNQIPSNNTAQLSCSTKITDTTNWVQDRGSFIADSSYQYIVIGNFFDDVHTDTSRIENMTLPIYAYYYIDDVCVSTDSIYANTWATGIKNFSNVNSVVLNQNQPNPFAEQTIITYSIPQTANIAQILFYDMNGKQINSVTITAKGAGQLNVYANDLTNGTYSYTLIVDGTIIDTKKMIKQQ